MSLFSEHTGRLKIHAKIYANICEIKISYLHHDTHTLTHIHTQRHRLWLLMTIPAWRTLVLLQNPLSSLCHRCPPCLCPKEPSHCSSIKLDFISKEINNLSETAPHFYNIKLCHQVPSFQSMYYIF